MAGPSAGKSQSAKKKQRAANTKKQDKKSQNRQLIAQGVGKADRRVARKKKRGYGSGGASFNELRRRRYAGMAAQTSSGDPGVKQRSGKGKGNKTPKHISGTLTDAKKRRIERAQERQAISDQLSVEDKIRRAEAKQKKGFNVDKELRKLRGQMNQEKE